MRQIIHDIRYGIRSLFRNPGLSAIAIVCLTLGIGANTAIFSVVHALLLNRLPFPDSARVMTVWSMYEFDGNNPTTVSPANFLDWQDQNTVFESTSVQGGTSRNLTGSEMPRRLIGSRVSAGFFDVLGIPPMLGRPFAAEDDRADAEKTVIISATLWREAFNADEQIVGKTIELSEVPHTVIGVMPESFDYPPRHEFWVPAAFDDEEAARRDLIYLQMIGRLKPEVSLARARSEMTTLTMRMREAYPEENYGLGVALIPLHEQLVKGFKPTVLLLLGAVGLVLLIACANVANLLLVKGASRQREMSIRCALGAGRLRMIRQLLTESIVLALAGGVFGILLANWGIEILVAFFSERLPSFLRDGITMNGPVMLFALGVSLLTGVLFGLAPAISSSRIDLSRTMKDRDASESFGGRLLSLKSLLVVGEISLSFVLLIGAALLSQSLQRLMASDTGFDESNVLTMRTSLPEPRYEDPERCVEFFRDSLTRIRALPEVESAGAVLTLPFSGSVMGYGYLVKGRPMPEPGEGLGAMFDAVTPGYFQTMRIPLLRGRLFDERDDRESAKVVIISEAMASEGWPDEDPIGQFITTGEGDTEEEWMEIVGVVGDIQHIQLGEETTSRMYFPHTQRAFNSMTYCMRSSHGLEAIDSVRRAVAEVDPDQPLVHVRMMRELVDDETALPRMSAMMTGGFALVALMLATVGLYGVMSFGVTQRTREIGVRMALGAHRGDVIYQFIRQGLVLTVVGIGVGLVSAFWLTKLIATQLFEVAPHDPWTLLVMAVILSAVALLACYIPARRATRIDPMVALRYE